VKVGDGVFVGAGVKLDVTVSVGKTIAGVLVGGSWGMKGVNVLVGGAGVVAAVMGVSVFGIITICCWRRKISPIKNDMPTSVNSEPVMIVLFPGAMENFSTFKILIPVNRRKTPPAIKKVARVGSGLVMSGIMSLLHFRRPAHLANVSTSQKRKPYALAVFAAF
jgi:hypothetical protein